MRSQGKSGQADVLPLYAPWCGTEGCQHRHADPLLCKQGGAGVGGCRGRNGSMHVVEHEEVLLGGYRRGGGEQGNGGAHPASRSSAVYHVCYTQPAHSRVAGRRAVLPVTTSPSECAAMDAHAFNAKIDCKKQACIQPKCGNTGRAALVMHPP